jgi:hypothetical protein
MESLALAVALALFGLAGCDDFASLSAAWDASMDGPRADLAPVRDAFRRFDGPPPEQGDGGVICGGATCLTAAGTCRKVATGCDLPGGRCDCIDNNLGFMCLAPGVCGCRMTGDCPMGMICRFENGTCNKAGCAFPAAACQADGDCCGGHCLPGPMGNTCSLNLTATPCGRPVDCFSGLCAAGLCQCVALGSPCGADDQCCHGYCNGGVCYCLPPGATCVGGVSGSQGCCAGTMINPAGGCQCL